MNKRLSVAGLLIIMVLACRQSASPTVNDVVDSNIGQRKVTTDTKGPDSLSYMDTTKLSVDSVANITLNGTTLRKKENAIYQALYNNWLLAYSESKHLPAVLRITYTGTVMMGIRGDVLDAVVKAQENMKNYIARDNYKRRFDSLQPDQQSALQQQHTILFQKEFR